MNEYKKIKEEVVWYYCNHKVFENIISNRELWLTDITKSNDSNEIKRSLSLLEQITCECIESNFVEYERTLKELLIKCCKNSIATAEKSCVWFAMCLSEKENNLSQWRTYGEQGKGYSIGFSTKKMEKLIEEYSVGSKKIKFAAMRYVSPFDSINSKRTENTKSNNRKIFLQTNAQRLCSELKKYGAGLLNGQGRLIQKVEDSFRNFVYDMVLPIAFFKDNDFQMENEARICYARYIGVDKLSDDALSNKEQSFMNLLNFTFKEGEIIQYIKLKVEDMQDLIKEIIIGPNNGASVDVVKRFLVRVGKFPSNHNAICEATIKKSNISCR